MNDNINSCRTLPTYPACYRRMHHEKSLQVVSISIVEHVIYALDEADRGVIVRLRHRVEINDGEFVIYNRIKGSNVKQQNLMKIWSSTKNKFNKTFEKDRKVSYFFEIDLIHIDSIGHHNDDAITLPIFSANI